MGVDSGLGFSTKFLFPYGSIDNMTYATTLRIYLCRVGTSASSLGTLHYFMVLMSTIQFSLYDVRFPTHTHSVYLTRLSYSSGDCWHAMGKLMDYYNSTTITTTTATATATFLLPFLSLGTQIFMPFTVFIAYYRPINQPMRMLGFFFFSLLLLELFSFSVGAAAGGGGITASLRISRLQVMKGTMVSSLLGDGMEESNMAESGEE
ncbi:hypothetical protein M434DRAFT_168403 [Hypoxylon sp. CO27-5]|nr:hypothetical protein M434DRAFT_168403 [Hypoxylon sp. CO27-5]